MVDKKLIEIWRDAVKPSVSLWLLSTDYEEMGEQDKEEFERDFDEILDLALIGLKYKNLPVASDMISRQAAKEAYCKHFCYRGVACPDNLCKEVNEAFDKLPPAQSEREKGKWIQNDNGTYSCSLCHSWIPEEQHYYAQFCLYCGADMRGEEDG